MQYNVYVYIFVPYMIVCCFLMPQLLLAVLVVGLFQGYRKSHTWIIATGLAQVSEFSIVLGSRARRLRIMTREVSVV